MSDKPVAWAVQLSSGNLITASTDKNAELEWAGNYDGATVIPLYTQPQPAVPEGCQHENTYRTGLGYIACYQCEKSWHPNDELPSHLQHMRSSRG